MTAGRQPARRSLAVAAIVSALLAIVAAGGGCEVAIGDTVPAFACNGGPDPCPAGQVCDIGHHQCVPNCLMSGCKGGAVCDQNTGVCGPSTGGDSGGPEVSVNDTGTDAVDVVDSQSGDEEAAPPMESGPGPDVVSNCPTGGPGGVLCSCGGDSQCASKLCVVELAVGNALWQAANMTSFCSQPCCTSADCPQSPTATVCYATGQGGNYCVNPEWIGRTGGTGTAQGGASCSTGRNCRSGLCTGGHCVDTCCSSAQSSSQCAGGETCTYNTFPGANAVDQNYSAFCGTGGSKSGGSSCFQPTECQSGICGAAQGQSSNHCQNLCRNSSDCTSGNTCNYVIPPLMNPPNPNPIVGACLPTQGSLTIGQTCDPSNDMCQGFCDPATKQCTDVCFADSDCSSVMSGWRCRDETIPVMAGSYSVLCCGP